MADLRRRGLVKAYLDQARGRTHLYSLAFDSFDLDVLQLRPGVYYIDVPPDAKIPHDLTFRAYSVTRASDILLYTPHFENKKQLFYLTRCICYVRLYTPETAEEVLQAATRGKVVSVIYSSQIDDLYVPENAAVIEHLQITIKAVQS